MKRALMALLGITVLIMPTASFAGNCGDVNNNGAINILDITYLINYVYRGGPEPDCGPIGTVTDIDGNIYLTIKIGDQWWMMENLKVTHYRNGDPIPNVTDYGGWEALSTGAYCNYDNDEGHVAVYGRLYNWYAVDDSRNIAPEGWHVPSDAEWQTLVDYLGGNLVAGGKMKEAGISHWYTPNEGATNESGFTALPGGYRWFDGSFGYMGNEAYFWSFTEANSLTAWCRGLFYFSSGVGRYSDGKRLGHSVRCVRD
jgi:uncharacterized protein (TIGR02145 family)